MLGRYASGFHILVWSPQPLAAGMLGRVLENAGHQVRIVASEADALTALEDVFFDVLIIHRAEADSIDLGVLKLHRFAHPDQPALPAIVIASVFSAELRRQCDEARVAALLLTPVRAVQVLRAVDDLAMVVQRRRRAV